MDYSQSLSCHRLPTLSASQALNAQRTRKPNLSSGSLELDAVLGGSVRKENSKRGKYRSSQQEPRATSPLGAPGGGFERGRLTEICGPPGSGKTTMAMQVAANALLAEENVLWIDTAHPVVLQRMVNFLSSSSDSDPQLRLHSLRLLKCPTLAHLIALILHPSPNFLAQNTTVMVIDSVSSLLSVAFPPGMEDKFTTKAQSKGGGNAGQETQGARKLSIINDLANGLTKLANAHGMAVLVLNQMNTKVVKGVGAILQPAVDSITWNNAFTNRLLIYRDDIYRYQEERQQRSERYPVLPPSTPLSAIRFVCVQKANGVEYDENEPVVIITILKEGIKDVQVSDSGNLEPDQDLSMSRYSLTQKHSPTKRDSSTCEEGSSSAPQPHAPTPDEAAEMLEFAQGQPYECHQNLAQLDAKVKPPQFWMGFQRYQRSQIKENQNRIHQDQPQQQDINEGFQFDEFDDFSDDCDVTGECGSSQKEVFGENHYGAEIPATYSSSYQLTPQNSSETNKYHSDHEKQHLDLHPKNLSKAVPELLTPHHLSIESKEEIRNPKQPADIDCCRQTHHELQTSSPKQLRDSQPIGPPEDNKYKPEIHHRNSEHLSIRPGSQSPSSCPPTSFSGSPQVSPAQLHSSSSRSKSSTQRPLAPIASIQQTCPDNPDHQFIDDENKAEPLRKDDVLEIVPIQHVENNLKDERPRQNEQDKKLVGRSCEGTQLSLERRGQMPSVVIGKRKREITDVIMDSEGEDDELSPS